jgi:hypothetical protein
MLATIAFILIFATLISGVWDRGRLSVTVYLVSWALVAILFAVHATAPPVVVP